MMSISLLLYLVILLEFYLLLFIIFSEFAKLDLRHPQVTISESKRHIFLT